MRTSYLPNEILWGHRLTPLVTYQKENGHYTIDHKQFHHAIPVTIPQCSARAQAEARIARWELLAQKLRVLLMPLSTQSEMVEQLREYLNPQRPVKKQ